MEPGKRLTAVTVRMATNADGEVIGALVRAGGFDLEADWSAVAPFWLIAETDRPVGAVQVCPGRPVGRLEFLCFADDADDRTKLSALKMLLFQGCATLQRGGSDYASGMVPFENKWLKRRYKKAGAVTMSTGNLMLKRLGP